MEQAFGYIIKVIYFVPLVRHQCSVSVLSKTDGRGNDCVIGVRFTVSPNMKSKTTGEEAFLDAVADVHYRLSAQGNPIVFGEMYQTSTP
tara:strand:- start:60 stop:326 length:267 start_codon:yes stop_codon:yes gene_type:complete